MKVLGIDPGTLNLGWGFIHSDQSQNFKKIEHGCLQAPKKMDFYQRLHYLSGTLEEVLSELRPEVVVIEKIFLGKSVDSAFKLGHIRGICAALCQRQQAQVVEYAARTVKKQITGSGSAEKTIVQSFLYQQLNLKKPPASLDASDALALAFCHILQDSVRSRHQRGMGLS